jgi:hypothetical protein
MPPPTSQDGVAFSALGHESVSGEPGRGSVDVGCAARMIGGSSEDPVRIREERMAGDADFATFYEANYERLVVQLFAVTGNLQDAEDVVQEAFARACLRWRRLHAYGRPAAWCGGWRSIWPCRACGVPAARSGWRAGRTGPRAAAADHRAARPGPGARRLSLRHRQVLALHYPGRPAGRGDRPRPGPARRHGQVPPGARPPAPCRSAHRREGGRP